MEAAGDAGDSAEASISQDASHECASSDTTCDALDDDCDGRTDESFGVHCVFGRIAVSCAEGQLVTDNCDDHNPCTVDSCGPTGCVHEAVSCDDGNPCTVDQCDANGDCSSVPAPSLPCDDGDSCTTGDVCTETGSCAGGSAASVDDGNPCTIDACSPVTGVTHQPAVGESCDDGNACTSEDRCNATGGCGGMLRELGDGDPCTADSCDPASGAITHTVVPEGSSCSDGDACNGDETCRLLPEVAFNIRSLQSFYRVDNSDAATDASVIRLADYGFAVGQHVTFRTRGFYDGQPTGYAYAVFSSSSTLLDHTQLNRIPGAILSAAPPFFTGQTFYEHRTTNIAEDFQITPTSLEVEIPAGSQYLFLSNFDSFFADSSGSLDVVLQTDAQSCVAGSAPAVDDANACTADQCDPSTGVSHVAVPDGTSCALSGGTGACASGQCVACSEQPGVCEGQ